jgi:hypothetical protein
MVLGWTFLYPLGSHLRSSRMAPCLSKGRLPSRPWGRELRDVIEIIRWSLRPCWLHQTRTRGAAPFGKSRAGKSPKIVLPLRSRVKSESEDALLTLSLS